MITPHIGPRPRPQVDPDERRLTPAEVAVLSRLLRGRVGWRGVRALAAELGVSPATLQRAHLRLRQRPSTIRRLRAALAERCRPALVVIRGGRS